jgi:hypothetical protein
MGLGLILEQYSAKSSALKKISRRKDWTIMKVLQFALGVSLLLSGSSPGTAQNGSASINAQSSQPIVTSCEENIALLSGSHQVAGEDGLIIAIARLGDGEHRRELNRRRLHNVLVYLTEFDWQRAPKTVIEAEGERVRGLVAWSCTLPVSC